jgi:glycerol-3-phosphate dehydrogenase
LHYAGVRPLPYVDKSSPAAITRRHWIETYPGELPLFSVIGGKLTTCRSLAEHAAETVMSRWGAKPSVNSRNRPIPGASGNGDRPADVSHAQRSFAEQTGLELEQIQCIWRLAASPLKDSLATTKSIAGPERRSLTGTHIPRHFARQVLRREWITRLVDVVERRLMLLYDAALSTACLRELSQMMVEEGLLPPANVDDEVEHCRQRLLSHYGRRVESSTVASNVNCTADCKGN